MFGFENNWEDITGEVLRDAYARKLKDAAKESCDADKQWFLSVTRLEERPVEPVSHLNWTYILLMTIKFVFGPPIFLS